jgi:hypothetical protein
MPPVASVCAVPPVCAMAAMPAVAFVCRVASVGPVTAMPLVTAALAIACAPGALGRAVVSMRALSCVRLVASMVLITGAVCLVILMGVVTAAVAGPAIVLPMTGLGMGGVLVDGAALVPTVIVWHGVTALAVRVADHVVRGVRVACLIVAGVVGVVFGSSAARARHPTGGRARRPTARSLRALKRGIGQQCARSVELLLHLDGGTDVRPGARGRHLLPDSLDDGLEPRTG